MRATDLLTIDGAAELRRLGEATLEGPWQAATELVRRAIGAGARRVEVELHRRRLVVRDDGRPLARDRSRELERLVTLGQPREGQHAALVKLELEPELLSIAALRPTRLRFDPGIGGAGTSLVIEVHGLDVDAARRWLHACGRFAPAQIVIDGVPLRRGFEGSLAEAALEPPSTGQIAVTADETAHLWLLAKGIVSSHLTLPQAPGFEAALELASSATSCSPASLRDAVEPRLGTLVDQAVGLMLEAAATASVDEATLRTLRSRMLLAAHRGWRRAEIFRAPLLLALDGPLGRSTRRLRLVDLGAAHGLPCLAPDEDPALYRLPASPVLVLDAVERGRLAQLLKLSFRSLGRSRVPRRGLARLRHGLRGLGERLRTIATRLRHPREGHALSPSALGSQERALLDELRAAAPAGIARIALTSGGSPPRRAGDVLLLPRRNADVAAAARAVARDPRWTRAAIIALGEDVRREADRVTADP